MIEESARLLTRWGTAIARPRNAHTNEALLTARRPNERLLATAAGRLVDQGYSAVVSPPVPSRRTAPWVAAGFAPYEVFVVMRASLRLPVSSPADQVTTLSDPEAALAVDRTAFDAEWQYSPAGLTDSLRATATSRLLGIENGSGPSAYAVVGLAGPQGFLQRIAVRPEEQGKGLGRSLVRAAKQWARNRGAEVMVLNSRIGNQGAHSLYRSEGFEMDDEHLHVLRYEAP